MPSLQLVVLDFEKLSYDCPFSNYKKGEGENLNCLKCLDLLPVCKRWKYRMNCFISFSEQQATHLWQEHPKKRFFDSTHHTKPPSTSFRGISEWLQGIHTFANSEGNTKMLPVWSPTQGFPLRFSYCVATALQSTSAGSSWMCAVSRTTPRCLTLLLHSTASQNQCEQEGFWRFGENSSSTYRCYPNLVCKRVWVERASLEWARATGNTSSAEDWCCSCFSQRLQKGNGNGIWPVQYQMG